MNRPHTRRIQNRRTPKVVHLIGALGSGGAERQLVNLATAQKRRGCDVRVLTMEPPVGSWGFLLPALQAQHVPATQIDRKTDPAQTLRGLPHMEALLAQCPNWLKPWPFEIAQTLLAEPPDILHIWLDFTNVTGAIAGLLLGVPHIILSTRNVNPTHFPYLNIPWYQPWYAFLSTVPDIALLNNSEAGRRDYAEWMQVPVERFDVIRNGVDTELYNAVKPHEGDAFRQELGLMSSERLLTGVFRLSEEKRPRLFMEVAMRLLEERPALHAAILGYGPMEAEMRERIAASAVGGRIHLLAPRSSMPEVYAASDVLLQTSILEGTPNSLLEAQSAGCPVVTTTGGGAGECALDGRTGFVAETAEEMHARVSQILDDAALRARMAAAGPGFVSERFGMGRMVDAYAALYTALIDGAR